MVVKHIKFIKSDYVLISIALTLSAFGLFLVYSATLGELSAKKLYVQALALVLGLFLMLIFSCIDYLSYKPYKNHIYVLSLAVLIFVLIFGSGKEETGAKSWIRFLGIGIQPSELAKISFALSFSFYLENLKENKTLNDFKSILKLCGLFFAQVLTVVLQNDTGTALVFAFMFAVMLLISGIFPKIILLFSLILTIVLPLLWLFMAQYQRDRILVFLNPEKDPLGAGYQVLQSKISIGSGKLFGRGFLNGPQNRLSLIPENETDFIFATLGEEFGFLGCAVVVCLLFLFVLRIFNIACKINNTGAKTLLMGLGAYFLFHITENIGMCIGLLPVTGVPLPYLSYGGSSLVTNYIALGIILNIEKHSNNLYFGQG